MEVENPMVVDSLWREKEKEPAVFGECAGCMENIVACEDYYELEDSLGNTVLVHQTSDCCWHYVAEISECKTAGEE